MPANFYFIPYFLQRFPELKYIHTIRNGLDMAFSRNQNQLCNWGDYFGIDPETASSEVASLDYWIQANRTAIEHGKGLGERNFLLIDFDVLCETPAAVIDELLAFLDYREPADHRLPELITPPQSRHRFRREDCSGFRADQLAAVASFGFEIS